MAKDVISTEVRWDDDLKEYEIGVVVNGEWKESWTLNREFALENAEDKAEEIYFGEDGINHAQMKYVDELSGFLKSPKIEVNKKIKDEPKETRSILEGCLGCLAIDISSYFGVSGKIGRLNAAIQDDIDADAFNENQGLEAYQKILKDMTDLVEKATVARRKRIAYNLK